MVSKIATVYFLALIAYNAIDAATLARREESLKDDAEEAVKSLTEDLKALTDKYSISLDNIYNDMLKMRESMVEDIIKQVDLLARATVDEIGQMTNIAIRRGINVLDCTRGNVAEISETPNDIRTFANLKGIQGVMDEVQDRLDDARMLANSLNDVATSLTAEVNRCAKAEDVEECYAEVISGVESAASEVLVQITANSKQLANLLIANNLQIHDLISKNANQSSEYINYLSDAMLECIQNEVEANS